jgi:hypothetical protein
MEFMKKRLGWTISLHEIQFNLKSKIEFMKKRETRMNYTCKVDTGITAGREKLGVGRIP